TLDAEHLADVLLRPFEAHRQQHKLSGPEFVSLSDFLELPLTVDLVPLDLHGANAGDVALLVTDELLAHHAEGPRIVPKFRRDLLMAIVSAQDAWPLRPGIVGRSLLGRLGEQFKVDETFAPVTHRGADAVGPGVAAADDDDVFAFGTDEMSIARNGTEAVPYRTNLPAVEQTLGVRRE